LSAPQLLTVLAGFLRGPEVPRTTQLWVAALRRCSWHLVLVFDNAPPAQLPAEWQGHDLTLLFERHGAYDFGSYQRGLAAAQERGLLQQASHLLLCNDSVVGPLGDLRPLLERMQARTDQAWGLTASHQLTPHLQSYFLLMGREVFQHRQLQAFFAGITRLESRQAVIQRYELGLSRALLAAGFALKAWVAPQQLLNPATGQPVGNPTAYPLSLVELGVPVIKARAMRERAANQEGFAATCRLIAERQPQLWQALLEESPHWRLWLQECSIAVVLQPEHWAELDQRLHWLQDLHLARASLWLPVPAAAQQRLAQLRQAYAEPIAQQRLQLVAVGDQAPLGAQWNQLIAIAQTEWIALGCDALWRTPVGLQLAAREVVRQPLRAWSASKPRLLHRLSWIGRGGFSPAQNPLEQVHRLAATE
jgi:hypothetical protein